MKGVPPHRFNNRLEITSLMHGDQEITRRRINQSQSLTLLIIRDIN